MKTIPTILKAQLVETSANSNEYRLVRHNNEYDEAEHGREWLGDAEGYVSNYIDCLRKYNGVELHITEDVKVINARGNAIRGIVLADESGTPREMFWGTEIYDEDEEA